MNNQRRKELAAIAEELSGLRSRLEELQAAEQEAFDNMPESLQQSDKGQVSEQAASRLEDALSAFDEIESCISDATEGA